MGSVSAMDDDAPLIGEDEFYDFLIEAQGKAVEASERLGLSNEDLQKLEARWLEIGRRGKDDGHLDGFFVASMARHVLTIRRVQLLAAMMKPDETMVPLVELADRFDKSGGDT